MTLREFFLTLKGGRGSGNFDHSGRPGKIGGSGLSFSSTTERIWTGQITPEPSALSRLEIGDMGEQMTIQAVKDALGVELKTLNVGINNSPIDLGSKEMAVEVKTGLSNSSAGAWRATIGQLGKRERELVNQMTPQEKLEYYQHKNQKAIDRKTELLKELSEISGQQVKGYTAGVIMSPDGKKGDVFLVEGFHSRLNWREYATDNYYIGSYEL